MAKELDAGVEAFRTRLPGGSPYTYLWLDALTEKYSPVNRIRLVGAEGSFFTSVRIDPNGS